MNNKAIIGFGSSQDMKNSADLGVCYPPRPSASVDNTLLDLQNSSNPTQPHSIIGFRSRVTFFGSLVDGLYEPNKKTFAQALFLILNTPKVVSKNEISVYFSTNAILA